MNVNQLLSLERQGMNEKEKELFLHDVKKLLLEYMDFDENVLLDVTRTENGFSVCIIFTAHRIKKVRAPQ